MIKKYSAALIALCIICIVLTGCAESSRVIEIDVDLTALSRIMAEAKFFDIVTNSAEYLGKTIRVSGPYFTLFFNNQIYHYVIIILSDGCCPPDGFEFRLTEGNMALTDHLRQGTMIEITGELGFYMEDNFRFLYLSVSDMDEVIIAEQ